MRLLVVFAYAVAVASASYLSPIYSSSQHIPTIDATGVPVDTLAVQKAKAAHFIAKAQTLAQNGEYINGVISPISAPLVSTYAATPVHSTYTNTFVAPAYATITYSGPQHIPTIGANGVPVDTPAVQFAKAAHFAAKAEISAHNGAGQNVLSPVATTYASSPIVATKYTGPQHIPIIGVDGVPVDTPAVQSAKAFHFAAKSIAEARNVDAQKVEVALPAASTYSSWVETPVVSQITTKYNGPQHIPTIGSDGVPVDTPAVQSAKAAHFAAKSIAEARSVDTQKIKVTVPAESTYNSWVETPVISKISTKYNGPQHIPTIGSDGVPVDTPAVQSAKAAHFIAKSEAEARNGDNIEGIVTNVAEPVVSTYTSSIATSAGVPSTYSGPQHIPTIGKDGVPVDTPAVQSAKAAHFAAKAEAKARSGEYVEGSSITSVSSPVALNYISSPAFSYISKPVVSSYISDPAISTYGALYNKYSTYSSLLPGQLPAAYSTTVGIPTIIKSVPQETVQKW